MIQQHVTTIAGPRGRPRASMFLLCAGALVASGVAAGCGSEEPGAAQPAAVEVKGVTHARVEGMLDVGTLGVLNRAISSARRQGHERLIVEIDTPGGSIDLMWKTAKLLREASEQGVVPVAWIKRHAVSAGVLVALACDRIYITADGSIGSAVPVTATATGIASLPDERVREKVTSALRSEFRAMAERHNRSPALAEAMVDADVEVRQVLVDGERRLITGQEWDDARAGGNPPELVRTIVARGNVLNLTGSEAVELGFADGLAATLDDVVDFIGYAGAPVESIARTSSDEVLVWIDHLWMLLLIAGIVLAYVEFKLPGFGLPGILSIACFGVVVAGRYLAGLADIPHIVAVTVGVVLVALELFLFPGTLWLGIAGVCLVVGGVILGSVGPTFGFTNALDQELILDVSFRFMGAAVIAAIAAWLLSRVLPKAPLVNRLVLAPAEGSAFAGAMPEASGAHARAARAGSLGTVRSALRPVGKVVLDADPSLEYEALANGGLLDRGARVRVIEVSAARLVVEAASEPAPTGTPGAAATTPGAAATTPGTATRSASDARPS